MANDLPVKPLGAQEPQPTGEAPISDAAPEATSAADGVHIYDISGKEPVLGMVPHDQVTQAVASGRYSLPQGAPIHVLNQDGELGTIPREQAAEAFKSGYRYASPDEVEAGEYAGTGQTVKAAAEGLAKGIAGPIATAAETGLFDNAKEQEARARQHPYAHYGAEALGLVAPALATAGASALGRLGVEGAASAAPALGAVADNSLAGVLGKAGEAGAAALGLSTPVTIPAKIGSAAVKGFIENGLFQAQDEVSKMIQDPNTSTEAALANVGLAAGIGAGIGGTAGLAFHGAVNPLWKATVGPKVESFLTALSNRVNGTPIGIPAAASEALRATGIEIAPTVRAAMSGNPEAIKNFGVLRETKHPEVMAGLQKLNTDIQEGTMAALGKTPEDFHSYSEAEQGRKAMDTYKEEYKKAYAPIQDEYEAVAGPFKEAKLPGAKLGAYGDVAVPSSTAQLAEKVSELGERIGANAEGSPTRAIYNHVMARIPKLETVQDVSNLMSTVREMTKNDSALWNVGSELKKVLLNGQQEALETLMGAEGPELFNRYKNVRQAYAQVSRVSDEAANHLGLGHTGGPEGFLAKLEEKRTPEDFLRRLSPQKNAEIIPFLEKNFPETLEKVRENELYKTFDKSVRGRREGELINASSVKKAIEGMSPEMRKFALPPGAEDKLSAFDAIQSAVPGHKSSGTAGWLHEMISGVPESATATAGMLLGHNAGASWLLGHLGKLLATDAPNAVRLAMLKFMGSSEPVSASGIKAAVDFAHNMIKGESLITKAAKNVLKAESEVIPASKFPTEKNRTQIDNAVQKVAVNPKELLKVADSHSPYLPEHTAAMAGLTTTVLNYLNSQRPASGRQASPLDPPSKPSTQELAAYNRALDTAQQPLVVMDRIQKGTIIPQDVVAIKTMYPNLYDKLAKQLSSNMMDMQAKGEIVPYKMRMGLSMFLAHPLDSTMTPFAIQAAQPVPAQNSQKPPPASSTKSIAKIGDRYMTQSQQAESDRSARS